MRKKIYVTETPLIKEWDFSKNKEFDPSNLLQFSNKTVWWKCEKCEYEWQARVCERSIGKGGCRECVSLAFKRPDLEAQWDYDKNCDFTPHDVTCGSDKEAWWKCEKCGNEWSSKVKDRCAGHKNCKRCNSLYTLRPDLAIQWDYERNLGLIPYDVTCGSGKEVWWKCEKCGYGWQAKIYDRCSGGKNCKQCVSLATKSPHLVQQWDYDKNDLSPNDVSYGSGKAVWWKCENGHSWEAEVFSRVAGNGCRFCSGKVACENNCLAILRPDLTAEWDYILNDDSGFTPDNVTCGSEYKAWWKCEGCGHIWRTAIYNRNFGNGCPKCSKGPVSKISQKWLDSLGVPIKDREHYFKNLGFRVDAFVPETNKVYEFFGDYWHGNPEKYSVAEKNSHNGKTFGELYEDTKTRISRLKEAGYKVIYIWENDFRHILLKEENGKNRYKSNKKGLQGSNQTGH